MTDDAGGGRPDEHEPAVVDEQANHRFVIDVDGSVAELVYRRSEPDRLVLVHTGVPEELEGRGLGGRLVRAAIDRAEADGLTVAPWCPFARKWLEEHPEVAARVEMDLSPPPSKR